MYRAKPTFYTLNIVTLYLQDPPKTPHSGSSGDGVIVWGLEEACRVLAGKVGIMNIVSIIKMIDMIILIISLQAEIT